MKSKRVVMAVSLAAFFLVILFPLWGLLFPQPQVESLEENRNMTEWSFSGSLKDRIGTLEDYLNDHLAFRQSMISAVLRMISRNSSGVRTGRSFCVEIAPQKASRSPYFRLMEGRS